jgi:L-rhamnose mutarotase
MMHRASLIVVPILIAAALAATGCTPEQAHVRRYGQVLEVKPEKIEEYKRLHADVWPGVLKQIEECNIRNYSIYLGEVQKGRWYLFAYFEYTGDDFEADMAKMAADPTTQKWWDVCEPCQQPVPTRKEGEWWHTMEEVFHMD